MIEVRVQSSVDPATRPTAMTYTVRYDETRHVRIQDEIQFGVGVSTDGVALRTHYEFVPLERVNRIRATENIFVPLYLERELRERYDIELRPIVEAYQRQETERRAAETARQAEDVGRGILARFVRGVASRNADNTLGRVTYTYRIRTADTGGVWRDAPVRVNGTNIYADWVVPPSNTRLYIGADAYEVCHQPSEAEQRAEALLSSHLTPEQRETWATSYYFDVPMRAGRFNDIYRIRKNLTVQRRRNDRIIASYCIQAQDEDVAPADLALAQKLLLETEPREFHRIANVDAYDYFTALPMPAPKGQEPVIEPEPEQGRVYNGVNATITFDGLIQQAYAAIEAFNSISETTTRVREQRRVEAIELDRRYRELMIRRLDGEIFRLCRTRPANEIATDRARSPPADELMCRCIMDNLSSPIEE